MTEIASVINKETMSKIADSSFNLDKRMSAQDIAKPKEISNVNTQNWNPDKRLSTFKEQNLKEPTETKEVQKIACRNEHLEGKEHPKTGIFYERKPVENNNGEKVEGVFPVFDSACDVQLPETLHQGTDREQFKECNNQLKDKVENDPKIQEKFSKEQLEQIKNGDTPDGYTWHHSEEKGKMQLVDADIHNKTGHTGGKAIWGGGTEAR